MKYTIPCLFGLEALVADELRRLDLKNVRAENGRVHCDGGPADIPRLNINLRCGAGCWWSWPASRPRISRRCSRAWPPSPGRIASPGRGVPGEGLLHLLPAPLRPRLPGHCEKRPLPSGLVRPTAARPCRRPGTAIRSSSPSSRTPQPCTWTPPATDSTSGATGPTTTAPPAGDAGRRPGAALPLPGEDPFCDPFCGSGTIPIEAALIAKNRAPGLDRRFAAQKWQSLPAKLWLDAAEEAMDQEFHGQYDIWGGDIDPSAVELSRHNAELAGVDDCVRFEVADAGKFHRDSDYGQLVTNPPYGERLLEKREAEALYRSFGKAARTLPAGWRVLVLSSHTEFERAFGRSAEKKRKLYNGMLKCDAFFYHGGAKTEPDKG